MNDQVTYEPHTEPEFKADKLSPCPCCGGESQLIFKGNHATKNRSAITKCTKCRLKREVAAVHHSSEWCARTAIEGWNKRIEVQSK